MKKLILLLLLLVSTNVFALTLEEQLNENNKLEDIVKTKAKLLMDDTVYLSCINISHGKNTNSYFFYKGNVISGDYTMFIKNPSVLQGSPDVITNSPSLVDTYISKDYILFYKIMNDREFEYAHMWVKYTKNTNLITWNPYQLKELLNEYHMDTNILYFRGCESCPIVTFQCEIKSEKKDIQ